MNQPNNWKNSTHKRVFDNYEISPCKKYHHTDGASYIETCEKAEAEFWTLYGHIFGEGVFAIGDFNSRDAAESTFYRITGQQFTASYGANAHLQLMHAAEELAEALDLLLEQTVEYGLEARHHLNRRRGGRSKPCLGGT